MDRATVARHRRLTGPPATPVAAGHRSRWRVRDWRVRTKLAAVLVIPAVAFLVVAGLQAGLSMRQAATLDEFAAQVALGREVTALVHELQFERDWVSGQLAAAVASGPVDRDQVIESMASAQSAVAEARVAFDAAVAPLAQTAGLRQPVAEAVVALDGLATLHTGIAQGWLREQAVFDGYTRAIDAVLALLPTPLAVADFEVRGYPELAEAKELTAQIRGQLHSVISAGGLRPGESERLANLRAQRQAAQERFRLAATPEQLSHFDNVVRGQAVRATARLQQSATDQPAGAEVTAQQWWSAATTELELFREVEVALLAQVAAQVTQASQDQRRQTIIVSTAALLILLMSLLLPVGIGQSMVRSLRGLRGRAVGVAHQELPGLLERLRTTRASEPVLAPAVTPITAGADEVGEVADAFTQVHHSAVRLAVEQAQMRQNVNRIFVNLARRSQVLVERQLEVLDALEREEADPTRLSNLFQLDHLATRMRRNNDSLLALTHTDPVRRYEQPMLLATVAQAAIAEIERYKRVRDQLTADLYVPGFLVADLAHLLAELLDNATAFSDKDQLVTLTARRVTDPAGALLEIVDAGIGMSASALQEANQVLAEAPVIDEATSQRMGLVVVGHLAARHGLRVQLTAATTGVRASVWLPEQLLAAPPEPPSAPDDELPGPPPSRPRPTPAPSPRRTPTPSRPRRTPVRAEDVLGEATSAHDPESIWWSRPADRRANAGDGTEPVRPARAAVPVALAPPAPPPPVAHDRETGLPVRVPMAHLPSIARQPADAAPPTAGLDPGEVGGMLAAFYGGVHRAEAEVEVEAEAEVEAEVEAATAPEADRTTVTQEEHSGAESTST